MKTDIKDKIRELSVFDKKYQKYEKAFKYAIEMTEKEAHQAAEGLCHNLNTLQLNLAA